MTMNEIKIKHILIVDDDQEVILEIKEALFARLPNIEIDIAYNGKEAIDKMKADRHRYNLVILEVLVPKLNGADVCEMMTKDRSLKAIPVLLTSILPLRSEAFQRSLKKYEIFSVVQSIMEKPIVGEELADKVIDIIY